MNRYTRHGGILEQAASLLAEYYDNTGDRDGSRLSAALLDCQRDMEEAARNERALYDNAGFLLATCRAVEPLLDGLARTYPDRYPEIRKAWDMISTAVARVPTA